MQHKITAPSGRQVGYSCSCGQKFANENMAAKHADDENYELEMKKQEAAKVPEDNKTEAPKQEAAPQKPAAPVQPAKAAEAKPTPPANVNAATGEIVDLPTAANQAELGKLPPFQQAQALVNQYTKKMLGSDRAAQFVTTMAIMARKEPKFAQCTPESIVSSMMACVQLDLMPNTPEQYAFIIPYNNRQLNIMEAQFQVGYKGQLELARRSGNVRKIKAELVFKGDDFDVEYAPEEKVTHKPDLTVDRTNYANVTHAYAYAKMENGEIQYAVMTKSELDKVKNSSKAAGDKSPWATWATEMARKTVNKRLTKDLPASSTDNRLKLAAEIDSLSEAGKLVYADGQFSARAENALPSGVLNQIARASTTTEVNDILQALPVGDRKNAAPAATTRLKELAE